MGLLTARHQRRVSFRNDNCTTDIVSGTGIAASTLVRVANGKATRVDLSAISRLCSLEVDVPEDFAVVSVAYEHLYPMNPGFGLQQVIDFMQEKPDLGARNGDVPRRWKAYRQANK